VDRVGAAHWRLVLSNKQEEEMSEALQITIWSDYV
jgi:hypothetical protein